MPEQHVDQALRTATHDPDGPAPARALARMQLTHVQPLAGPLLSTTLGKTVSGSGTSGASA